MEVLWLTLIAFLLATANEDHVDFELSFATQIVEDWTQPGITSALLVESGQECPPTHPELLVSEKWAGSSSFCFCKGQFKFENCLI
jgi:hypothetical protein